MSVTYYKAAGQTPWSSPAPVSLPVWEQPFPELTDRLVFRQRYMIGASYFTPLAPNTTYHYPGPVSANVPTAVSFYLVSEDSFSDERGGILSWDRVYATVPTTRYEYTSLAYHYPAVMTGFSITGYTSVSIAQNAGVDRMFINYTGANPGDLVSLSYSYSGVSYTTQVYVRDYSNGGVIADLAAFFVSTTLPRSVARVYRSSNGRAGPVDLVGRAVIEYSYALITPNVTPVFTFNTRQKFTLDGQEVEFVSPYTNPTAASYSAWVTSGSFFRAEDDSWARWLGNIYEKRSVQIVAQ